MPLVFEHIETPTDDARLLIGELDAELNGSYEPQHRHGLSIARVFQPHVRFFIARLDGEPVGCGGIAFEDGFAEVKRMYVRPQARGRGVARTILNHLQEESRKSGVTRLTIETGDAQLTAIRLYERAGFTRCTAFGGYLTLPPVATARSVFLEKFNYPAAKITT
jgi:putative acetyltransferase